MRIQKIALTLLTAVSAFIVFAVAGTEFGSAYMDLSVAIGALFGISGTFVGAGLVSGRLGADVDRESRAVGLAIGTFSLVFLPAFLLAITRFGIVLVEATKLASGAGALAGVGIWLWLILNEPEPTAAEKSA